MRGQRYHVMRSPERYALSRMLCGYPTGREPVLVVVMVVVVVSFLCWFKCLQICVVFLVWRAFC